jgi:hypothetical protein
MTQLKFKTFTMNNEIFKVKGGRGPSECGLQSTDKYER